MLPRVKHSESDSREIAPVARHYGKNVPHSRRREQAVNDRERPSFHLRFGAKQSPSIRNRPING
jgi:hypothetical protein